MIAETIAHLRSLPDQVEAICTGLTEQQMRRAPQDGGWSAIEIICHLRDAAAEEGVRIRRMVEEENPTLAPYDQEAWAVQRNYRSEDPSRALTALRAFWTGLAYQLERLPAEAWNRRGFHPESGPTSVRERAQRAAEHARDHLTQLRSLVAALGPSVS